ncbi:MAG: hypothetical protein HUN04_15370 [Desulfobacter sp.]|nr:MAG: hypothetical protein HUN04_15370 [Desulfobacter sp.]
MDPAFLETDHGQIPCQDCHGGSPGDGNWQTAHTGLVRDPSLKSPAGACGDCHEEIAASAVSSLHYTLAPVFDAVLTRTDPSDLTVGEKLKPAMGRHCGSCHASCGQCHISRPDYVKGGFLSKHHFVKTPAMETTCASCHGGRVFAEFTGENEDFSPDLHFEDEEMACTHCHTGGEMHAAQGKASNRFGLKQRPGCRQCHAPVFSGEATNTAHENHIEKLDCRVCHAQAYKNCASCHVGTDKQGLPYFKCKKTEYGFKIGLNPDRSPSRPWEYVLVRQVPVEPDTFKFYGAGLGRFDSRPTWKPTSPHTILKETPQNRSCNHCHGNTALFLTEEDLAPGRAAANKNVLVPLDRIPEKIPDN